MFVPPSSPPIFMAVERRPVSTTEGTAIRITAKEVGEEKFFCSSRLSSYPSLPPEQERGITGRLAPALWTEHSRSPPQSIIRIKHNIVSN